MLLENRLKQELDPATLQSTPAGATLSRMLSWKDSWPFCRNAPLRRNRYYFKGTNSDSAHALDRVLECLRFTFGQDEHVNRGGAYVLDAIEEFAAAYTGRG